MIFRRLFSRRQIHADLAEEMHAHLTARVDELVVKGVPVSTARETAWREFGNPTLLEEQGRDVWRWRAIETLLRDARFALRRLGKARSFTAVSVLTLGLGLGANLAIFTLIRYVLLRPLPFQTPDRLVEIYEAEGHRLKADGNIVPAGTFADWQRGSHGFVEMAIRSWETFNLSGAGGQLPEKIETRDCSWNLFHTLGVKPVYGRLFSSADDKPGAPATAILTWGLFQRRFGADPAIIAQTILLDEKPYTVIGVLPSWFVYPDRKGQLWTAAYHDMPADWRQSHGNHAFNVVARLKDGISAARAVTEVAAIQARIHKQYPGEPAAESVSFQPLIDDIVGDFKTPLYVLLAAVGCVLLIACLNVSNLLLARSVARRKETAVRAALGGSAWRIIGEQMMESLLIALGGAVLAGGVAYALVHWIVNARPDLPRTESLEWDAPLLLFGICLTLATGLFAGLLPAILVRRDSLANVLQESSRTVRSGRSQAGLRKYLVGIEVALTAILLIGAALLLRSFAQLRSVPLGCTTKNVLTMSVSLPENKYKDPAKATVFFDALLGKIRALPDVIA